MFIISWKQGTNIVAFLCMMVIASGCLRSGSLSNSGACFDLSSVTFDEQTWPVVIIGGGVAGLTAAVYCAQANIPALILEGPKPGGSLSQSHSVRNWPGVLQAPGVDIVSNIRKQAQRGGSTMAEEKVTAVDFAQWPRIIQTEDPQDPSKTKTVKALCVIIATGTEPNYLQVPGETGDKGYWGKGVGNCAICEGSLYKGKHVAIVGGGDSAMAEADYLANIADKVTILVRKDFLKANDVKNRDKTLARSNVKVMFNTSVSEIKGNGSKLTHVILNNNTNNNKSELAIDGLFLAIGSSPNTSLFKNQLELDARNYIILKNFQETSRTGIYAAGDVCDFEFVQAVTAASDGCKSALQAIRCLKDHGFKNSMLVAKANNEQNNQDDEQPQDDSDEQDEAQDAVLQERSSARAEHAGIQELQSGQDFQSLVLKNDKPVVIDVFSTWCGPCKQMHPIFDKLAQELGENVTFVKLNASNKGLDMQMVTDKIGGKSIQTVPTFLLVKQGKEVGRLMGAHPSDVLRKKITTTFKLD